MFSMVWIEWSWLWIDLIEFVNRTGRIVLLQLYPKRLWRSKRLLWDPEFQLNDIHCFKVYIWILHDFFFCRSMWVSGCFVSGISNKCRARRELWVPLIFFLLNTKNILEGPQNCRDDSMFYVSYLFSFLWLSMYCFDYAFCLYPYLHQCYALKTWA